MRCNTASIGIWIYLLGFVLMGSIVAFGQRVTMPLEIRPFDFTDKFYSAYGVDPTMLIGRKSGTDGQSVLDVPDDVNFANVRITATLPAYSANGETLFWNYYGSVGRFANSREGIRAKQTARTYPILIFPSSTQKGADRQAALINIGEGYFSENPLGIGIVYVVEYTGAVNTAGGTILNLIEDRNGVSVDGTPIIKTLDDLEQLAANRLVVIRKVTTEDDRASFFVGKVIQFPAFGGITADAFLLYTKQADGTPLESEAHFLARFDCLKNALSCPN